MESGVLDPKKEHGKARLAAFLLGDVECYGSRDITVAMKLAELLGREAEQEGGLESEEGAIVVTGEKKRMRFEEWDFVDRVKANPCAET